MKATTWPTLMVGLPTTAAFQLTVAMGGALGVAAADVRWLAGRRRAGQRLDGGRRAGTRLGCGAADPR
jgi:hypothetical protein